MQAQTKSLVEEIREAVRDSQKQDRFEILTLRERCSDLEELLLLSSAHCHQTNDKMPRGPILRTSSPLSSIQHELPDDSADEIEDDSSAEHCDSQAENLVETDVSETVRSVNVSQQMSFARSLKSIRRDMNPF